MPNGTNDNLCLGLGERDGGLSLWLAQKGYSVLCTDLDEVTQNARDLHQEYGVDQIQYESADITLLQYEDETFDIIAFKSVLGALGSLEKQNKALTEIYRCLRPGGRLVFAENLVGSIGHKFFRKRFVNWSNYWRYLSIPELKQLCQDFRGLELETFGFLAAFGRSETQRRILALADKLLCPLLPSSQHYLCYGVALKDNTRI